MESFWYIGKSAAITVSQRNCNIPISVSVYKISLSSFLRCDNKGKPNLRIKVQPLIVPFSIISFFFKARIP